MERWIKNRSTQSDSKEQLTFAANVVEYVNYVWSETNVRKGAKDHADPPVLKVGIPLLGPLFLPPTYAHLQKRDKRPQVTPDVGYLKPIHIVHPFFYPGLKQCPQCDSTDEDLVSWQGWTTTGHREVHGVFREETALGYQLDCLACRETLDGRDTKNEADKGQSSAAKGKKQKKKGVAFATTNVKFWERRHHWEIPRKYQVQT